MDREKLLMAVTGVIIGALAVFLVVMGNPGNMGFCIACFLRDTAGGLGLHRAPVVQYVRPEIIGLAIGAFLAAKFTGEFKTRGGSNVFLRFLLGALMMVGALIFLGCPLRAILRLGGGDLNALVALVGFIFGVLWGVFFLRRGFNLGYAQVDKISQAGGYVFIGLVLVLLVMAAVALNVNPDAQGPLFYSKEGPGSMHAPLALALGAGLVVGILAQRARLCLSGGFRDFFLIGEKGLLIAYGGILLTAAVLNILLGKFNLGFANQPVAHTNHLFNFLGLFLLGQCAVLLGGCPLRQIVLASEGDTDAAAAVTGMIVGAAFCHNFMLAASPMGVTKYGVVALIASIAVASFIGWAYREVDA